MKLKGTDMAILYMLLGKGLDSGAFKQEPKDGKVPLFHLENNAKYYHEQLELEMKRLKAQDKRNKSKAS